MSMGNHHSVFVLHDTTKGPRVKHGAPSVTQRLQNLVDRRISACCDTQEVRVKVYASGASRFYGWRRVADGALTPGKYDVWPWHLNVGLLTLEKESGNYEIRFHTKNIQLNGDYHVGVQITRDEISTLAKTALSKQQLLELADLSDDEKVALARGASTDRPLGEMARTMAKTLLTRDEMLQIVALTDKEKITMARDVLKDVSFTMAASMLLGEPERQAA